MDLELELFAELLSMRERKRREQMEGAIAGSKAVALQAMRDGAAPGSVGAPGGLAESTENPYRSRGDAAVMGAVMAPGIGDVVGPVYDVQNFIRNPESRTLPNYALAALGALPAVPSLGYLMNRNVDPAKISNLARASNAEAGMVGYHGSPHQFDAFDISKIGTGEGAQRYGHGLYFAENPEVAASYKMAGVGSPIRYQDTPVSWLHSRIDEIDPSDARALAAIQYDASIADIKNNIKGGVYGDKTDDVQRLLDSGKVSEYQGGAFYHVDIPDEAIDKMLDWNAPLSEQNLDLSSLPDTVRPLDDVEAKNVTGQRLHQRLVNKFGEENASRLLRKAGIPGIKYYDQGSRASGKGTRNFVVFDDKLPKIIKRE